MKMVIYIWHYLWVIYIWHYLCSWDIWKWWYTWGVRLKMRASPRNYHPKSSSYWAPRTEVKHLIYTMLVACRFNKRYYWKRGRERWIEIEIEIEIDRDRDRDRDRDVNVDINLDVDIDIERGGEGEKQEGKKNAAAKTRTFKFQTQPGNLKTHTLTIKTKCDNPIIMYIYI